MHIITLTTMDKHNRYIVADTGSGSDSDPDQEPDPISEDDYYSEDFEQEAEDMEVIQEIEIPSPISPNQDRHSPRSAEEAPSEEAILVYKSVTGPRLTIQPRKIKNTVPTRIQGRTFSDVNVRGVANKFSTAQKQNATRAPACSVKTSTQRHQWQPAINLRAKGQPTDLVVQAKSQDSIVSQRIISRKSSLTVGMSGRGQRQGRQMIQASNSTSSCRLRLNSRNGFTPYNYRVTTTTICAGPLSGSGGNGKVPGTTNINNRNYTREKRIVPGRRPQGYNPPMRLGPSTNAIGNVTQRVASAKRITINDLKNRITMLVKESEDLRKENRCLKVCQNRQSLALKKWEGRDAELPKLLQQHKDQIKTTQIQLKKAMYTCRDLEEKLRFKDRKIAKMETDLQTLKTLATKNNLKERNDLQEQVDILSATVAGCEKKIRQYMRHIEIIENNHKHQISGEKQKLIKANNNALEHRHEITRLKIALRDKDRMLNYIQMRSTGRNLMKSFQEKERLQNEKLHPMKVYQIGSYSPRSRSISPKSSHPLSGRSLHSQFQSLQLHQPVELSPDRIQIQDQQIQVNQKESVDIEASSPDEIDTNNDDYYEDHGGFGDVGNNTVQLPTRNEYSKISKMLETNSKKNLKVEASNHSPNEIYKVQQNDIADIVPVKANKSKVPLGETSITCKSDNRRNSNHVPKPENVSSFSTGPKTHSFAKQEMKLKRQESAILVYAQIKKQIEDTKTPNEKLHPAKVNSFENHSSRSRSVGPNDSHSNHHSGRSFRSQSLHQPFELSQGRFQEQRRPIEPIHQSPHHGFENSEMDKGDHYRHSNYNAYDEPITSGGIGDVADAVHRLGVTEHTNSNGYSKTHGTISTRNYKGDKYPSSNQFPARMEKVQQYGPPELIPAKDSKSKIPLFGYPAVAEWGKRGQPIHHRSSEANVSSFSTGPKAHSVAKTEIKLNRQGSDLLTCARKNAQMGDAKKQKGSNRNFSISHYDPSFFAKLEVWK